jgi:hypothetical protein
MGPNTLKEGRVLIKTLGDKDLMKEANEARLVDPVDDLKMAVFEFFKRTIDSIDKREQLRLKIQTILEHRIDIEGDTMQVEELRSLYMMVSSEADRANDSIIGLFKPVPGAPSLLVNNVGAASGGEGDPDALYNRLSPEDRAVFERFRLLIEKKKLETETGNLSSKGES